MFCLFLVSCCILNRPLTVSASISCATSSRHYHLTYPLPPHTRRWWLQACFFYHIESSSADCNRAKMSDTQNLTHWRKHFDSLYYNQTSDLTFSVCGLKMPHISLNPFLTITSKIHEERQDRSFCLVMFILFLQHASVMRREHECIC